MSSLSFLAVSCVSRFAAAPKEDRFAAAQCPECERLEAAFLEARDRLRALTRLRRLTAIEEKQLIDRVAMAIARMKEHEAEHGLDRCKKGMAPR